MKNIYLRLIDEPPLELSESAMLRYVEKAVEDAVRIKWKKPPSMHLRGGYCVIGTIPEDEDLHVLSHKLVKAGFRLVI